MLWNVFLFDKFQKRAIRFAAFAHIVGWVKRNTGTIFVGFAYLNVPPHSEIALELANPTRSVADHRLNPTYDLPFRPTKWIPPFKNHGLIFFRISPSAFNMNIMKPFFTASSTSSSKKIAWISYFFPFSVFNCIKHAYPVNTGWHVNRRFWPRVGFDSVLKIAARVESLAYRKFYESAQTHTNPVEPDEPVLTG